MRPCAALQDELGHNVGSSPLGRTEFGRCVTSLITHHSTIVEWRVKPIELIGKLTAYGING